MPNKADALKLLNEYVKSGSLRKHCLSVAYAMEAYASSGTRNMLAAGLSGP